MNLNELTQRLIDIESVTGDEQELINFIESFLLDSGYKGNIFKDEGGIIVNAPDSNPKIALVGHLDTVPIHESQKNYSDEENIFGRGAVDMKAGVAVMIQTILDERDNVVGVFYTGEEGTPEQNGLNNLMSKLKEDFSIELAIVMEPSSLECQLGCNGTLNATLVIPGVSSHSARPWMGENPFFKLKELSEFLLKNEIKDYEIDGLIYKQVITVTRINGGVANNVTPPDITLNVNFRFVPSFSAEDAEKYITDELQKFGNVSVKDISVGALPNKNLDIISDFINFTGLKVTPKQGWTDVARFTNDGIPALNFGPGDPLLAHTSDEFVIKNEILESYEILNKFLESVT